MQDLYIILLLSCAFFDIMCFVFAETRKWYHYIPFGALISTIIYILKYRD